MEYKTITKNIIISLALFCCLILHGEIGYVDQANLIAGRFRPIPNRLRDSEYFQHNKTRGNTLEDALVNGWTELSPAIDISAYNLKVTDGDVILAILNKHPEIFYVDTAYSYSYDSRKINTIRPVYLTSDRTQIASMQAEIDKATAKALAFVPQKANALEIALTLHDYIATHCNYKSDLNGEHIRNIYGTLIQQEAVCSGYALTYIYLLSKLGIESETVCSNTMNHAWNMVTIDDKKYHVDVTWDDPVFSGRRVFKSYVSHNNFLLDDAGIRETGHVSWEDADIFTAADSKYNSFFWEKVTCKIPCLNGYAYVIDNDGVVGKYSLSTGKRTEVLHTIDEKWSVWGDYYSKYVNAYSTPALISERLFFNGPTQIYSYNLATGTLQILSFAYPADDGYIYGLYQDNVEQLQVRIAKNDFNDAGTYYNVEIDVPVTGISLNQSNAEITIDTKSFVLKATVLPNNASNQKVSWKSSNTSVAKVNSDGVVTPFAPGKAVISATTNDGGFIAKCTVMVIAPVTGIALDRDTANLNVGKGTVTLKATILPKNATNKTVSWKSSNPSVATVDSKGIVTPVSAGTAVISVTTDDGNYSANCTISVTVPVTGIVLDKSNAELFLGGSGCLLKATVLPQNATNQNISWKSSNTTVATVDANGMVSALAPGKAIITANTVDGYFSAECIITVTVPVTGITLDRSNAELFFGDTPLTLKATVLPLNATNQNIVWKSSNTAVATIDTQGIVTPVAVGNTIITATTADGDYMANCSITVKIRKNEIHLSSGWNLIAFKNLPSNTAELKNETFLECRKKYIVHPASISLGKAYWIFSKTDRILTYSYVLTNEQAQDAEDDSKGFVGISGKVPNWNLAQMQIYAWDGKQFIRLTDASQILPGHGYWIK